MILIFAEAWLFCVSTNKNKRGMQPLSSKNALQHSAISYLNFQVIVSSAEQADIAAAALTGSLVALPPSSSPVPVLAATLLKVFEAVLTSVNTPLLPQSVLSNLMHASCGMLSSVFTVKPVPLSADATVKFPPKGLARSVIMPAAINLAPTSLSA